MKAFLILILTVIYNFIYAGISGNISTGYDPVILLWLVIMIFLSRSFSIVKKFGLPVVVGEILSGVFLGQLHNLGINLFQDTQSNMVVRFLAALGAIILMFEIGLESKLHDLKRNFKSGIKLAISGTIFTFIAGFLIAKWLIPNANLSLELLIGVITAATATGISAKTFKELGILQSKEVKIVLVASILDELISILFFGIISGMIIDAEFNLFNFSITLFQVTTFFVFAAIFGNWITPLLTNWSTKIHAGINMKIGVLLIICFLFSWVAHILGLATVIGAFVAGLILDQVYFKSFSKSNFFTRVRTLTTKVENQHLRDQFEQLIEHEEEKSLEELLKPLSHVFVPVFFIYIGLLLDLKQLFTAFTMTITLSLLLVSFLGRILSGYLMQDKKINKLIMGLGMTPVGEAGLIFAVFGHVTGIINSSILSAVVSTVVISSIITPLLIKYAIRKHGIRQE
ncbi:MAG: cation:proton antiporter [Burkholderiales bacterium]|nr:cation:proton antiporter [Burkholderiales bacterium]